MGAQQQERIGRPQQRGDERARRTRSRHDQREPGTRFDRGGGEAERLAERRGNTGQPGGGGGQPIACDELVDGAGCKDQSQEEGCSLDDGDISAPPSSSSGHGRPATIVL
jgi:hypothetical protein